MLLCVHANEHELIRLTVNHQSLTILRPVKMAQSAGQTHLSSCDLLELHLSGDFYNFDWRETPVVAIGDFSAIRRKLNVFDPGVLLTRKTAIVSALDFQVVGIKKETGTVSVTGNNKFTVFGPVECRRVMCELLGHFFLEAGSPDAHSLV